MCVRGGWGGGGGNDRVGDDGLRVSKLSKEL